MEIGRSRHPALGHTYSLVEKWVGNRRWCKRKICHVRY